MKQVVFSPPELTKARMDLIYKKYGVLPDEVDEHGYYYEALNILKSIKKNKEKRKRA